MASAQKRTSSSSGGSRSRSSSKGNSQSTVRANSRTRKSAPPEKRPYRREIGAAVCLFLTLFSVIGYFPTDEGAFISLFCNLLKGLCGYGFYIAPPILLLCTLVLAFHKGRPVRLRLTGALLLPVLVGAFLHLILCRVSYEWSLELIGLLWKDGKAVAAGGVLGGVLAMAFRFAFTKIGAAAVFIALLLACTLCALRITPAQAIGYFRAKRENLP